MSRDQIAFGWPEIDAVWQRVTEAFAHYGKQIRPLRGARRDHMSRLVADGYTADELVAAVHGYVHWHKGLDARPDFDPRQYFTPDSVFRLEKLENRIEFGMAGPWRKPVNRHEERMRREEAEREANRRLVMEERKLRAVGGER